MPKRSPKKRSVLRSLLHFDRKIKDSHAELMIIGVDEVGRGCLAGPVVAAAASLPPIEPNSKLYSHLTKLNDSKKLQPEDRLELSKILHQHALFAVASASVQEIDQLNILQAGFLAMKRAINTVLATAQTQTKQMIVLVDGNKEIPQLDHRQMTIIQGDGLSASIAAASVIAKVCRDQLMSELSVTHPHYHWQKNKGYGSAVHRQAILKHGPCVWHRQKFIENLLSFDIDDQLEISTNDDESQSYI